MIVEDPQSDREMLRRMREAAQQRAPREPPDEDAQAVAYDWDSPHRYPRCQVVRLEATSAELARQITRALGERLHIEAELQPAGVTQHYGTRLGGGADEAPVYFTELIGPDGEPCGLVTVPSDVAAGWVARLLGGSPGDDTGELSGLETDLLLDILRAIAEGISAASQSAGGPAFSHGQQIARGPLALPDEESREYCRFAYQAGGPDGQSEVFFLIAADTVDAILGLRRETPEGTSAQAREALLGHLGQSPLPAAVQLGRADVTMREVLSLEVGDVVLLHRTPDEPVDVLVQGKVVLSANPVICEDRYAVQIVSWAQDASTELAVASGGP